MLRKRSHTVALLSVLATGFAVALLANWTPAVVAAGTEISFPAASSCALCHSRIPDPADERGGSIAPFTLWSGSMMAHSSRDPFWKAKLREEAALTPAAAEVIEDKCLRCHAPAQQYLLRGAATGMALRELRPDGEGVTCTVCHQISAAQLGTPASFTGGFPSRRIWLHLQAFSNTGTTLFESGAWDAHSGTLTGAVERQPHRSVISRPEQVMIYQAATQDAEGRPTTSLLRAASYAKDNRILPTGFDQSRGARIAPEGVAGDTGFRPGSHQVRYEIALPSGVAPARIRAEAVYQSINPAYLGKAPEFASLTTALVPVSIASIEVAPSPDK